MGEDGWLLALLIFTAAVSYSSVGHAGASGYLAAMALCGVAAEVMRPAALILNTIVATVGTVQYARAGCFSWRLFLPFTVGSMPFAALGGYLTLPSSVYRPAVGVILVLSAARMVFVNPVSDASRPKQLSVGLAVACGAGIGLLSGLTGTGGGIFLSPLLLLMGWAEGRETSGVSVAFILANSVAGLIGLLAKGLTVADGLAIWAVAAAAGGLLGSELGSKRLGNSSLRRLLAIVLMVAGLKMIFM